MTIDEAWPAARLGDVIEAKYGKALPKGNRSNGAVPVFGSNGIVGQHDIAITRGPTIVIGRKGSSGAVNFSPEPCWPIDTTYYVDDPGPYSIEFLTILLGSLGLTELDRSTAIPGLNRDQLYDIDVPVPKRDAQEAIVQFVSRSRELSADTLSHIMTARQAIGRFRSAVLTAACAGRLTADWRAEHPTAQSVDAALSEMVGSRKSRSRADEPPIDLPLPEIPDSYVVSTLGEAAELLEYGTSVRCDASAADGVLVLRMGNIQDGAIDCTDLKYCEPSRQIEKLTLRDGDLLFNRTNSPELVGKSAVFHEAGPMSFASYLIRVRFHGTVVHPDFANYWLNSAWGKEWARLVKTDGVSQSNINGTKLALMSIPLPPIEEQHVIVERASQMLASADKILGCFDAATASMESAGRAVLATAFQGRLKPAWRTDVP